MGDQKMSMEVDGSRSQEQLTFALPVDNDNKATVFRPYSFAAPHMRCFHLSWFSFFCCFVSTFAAPPLLPLIRDTLGLTATEITNAGIAAVSGAVFARLAMGTACDILGPRLASSTLILLTTPAVYYSALINDATSFLLVRFFTGFSLASFVSTQYWMSSMFTPRRVGVANGFAGGWGNLGGGATQLIMPLVYQLIVHIGSTNFTAWRIAFFIPGLMQTLSAIAVLALGQDLPAGNFRQLEKEGARHKDDFLTVLKYAATNYRAWVLALTYGYCFGVELTVDNVIAQYFYDKFNVKLATAGSIAASFGLMNIISRPGGGVFSDFMSKKFGMRGRLWSLWIVQTLGGVFCIILGKMNNLGPAIAVMIFFSFFAEAACGLTFGVVPFVSRRSLGLVSGMTGGGGNVGAVVTQLIFFHGNRYSNEDGITFMGVMIVGVSFAVTFIYFEQWGGVFCGPKPGVTAEDYYLKEYTADEIAKGWHLGSVKFSENSVREGGRGNAKTTVPVEASPA